MFRELQDGSGLSFVVFFFGLDVDLLAVLLQLSLPFNTWFTPPLMPKIRYVGVIRESIAIEEFASRNDIVEVVEPLMPAPDLNLWTTHSCQARC